MAIFKFDCFIPYCCFLGGDFGFGMAMVIVSLQIGIGEYVNFLVILTVILTSIF
jgi:hypothetical protein